MRDAQVLLAGHIGLLRRFAADHSDTSNPDTASVRLHFFHVLSRIADDVCEGLDDLLSLIDFMASEHDDDDVLQDGALQASLGLQHRQVVCVCVCVAHVDPGDDQHPLPRNMQA